jgi:hypothetical protein
MLSQAKKVEVFGASTYLAHSLLFMRYDYNIMVAGYFDA